MGIPVARIELVNALQMRAMKNYSKLDYPESPCLFVEFHGSDAGVEEQAESFGEIAEEFGGGPFLWTSVAEERTKLWKARHDAYWASLTLQAGRQGAVDRRLRADLAACRMHRRRRRPTSPKWA